MTVISLILAQGTLLIAAYFGSVLNQISGWFWFAAMAGGLLAVSLLTALRHIPNKQIVWIAPLVISVGLLVPLLSLDLTLATYVSGIWLLVSVLIIHLLPKSSTIPDGLALTTVMLAIALALLFVPVPINRVVLSLPKVGVPTHFALFAKSDTPPKANSMYKQHMHKLSPLTIELNTGSHPILPGAETPWLRLMVSRDSKISVEQILYKSQIAGFSIDVKKLRHQQLHQLKLSPLSDDVQLSKTNTGIEVDQIAYGEKAWIKLPSLNTGDIGKRDQMVIISIRLALWIFLCFAFLLWKPEIDRTLIQ